jgi:hypothetical protein
MFCPAKLARGICSLTDGKDGFQFGTVADIGAILNRKYRCASRPWYVDANVSL